MTQLNSSDECDLMDFKKKRCVLNSSCAFLISLLWVELQGKVRMEELMFHQAGEASLGLGTDCLLPADTAFTEYIGGKSLK